MRSSARSPRGDGWAAWQGLVTAAGGELVNTRRRRSSTSPASPGREARALPRSSAPDVATRRSRSPSGACLAIRREAWGELGGFAPRLLPLPRGHRPGTAPLADRPPRRDRAASALRPRLRVREGRPEVALPRAQPVGDDRPHLPGKAAAAARSGADRHRACAARWWRRREAGCRRSCAPNAEAIALAATPAPGAPRDPGDGRGRRRQVRLPAGTPTSTAPTSAEPRESRGAPAADSRLLAVVLRLL